MSVYYLVRYVNAMSLFSDPYGALNVWPSSYVAAEELYKLRRQTKLCEGFISLELGCGAALPSIAAITSLGASHAIATDSEILPLQMLQKAIGRHHKSKLTTQTLDLRHLQCLYDKTSSTSSPPTHTLQKMTSMTSDVEVDCCIASDLLYAKETAERVALFLSEKYTQSKGRCQLIVTTPKEGRRGRDHFLKTFVESVKSFDSEQYANFKAHFEDCLTPEWVSEDCVDGFDGCKIESISVLRYGSIRWNVLDTNEKGNV